MNAKLALLAALLALVSCTTSPLPTPSGGKAQTVLAKPVTVIRHGSQPEIGGMARVLK